MDTANNTDGTWQDAKTRFLVGNTVEGTIRHVTPFGVFVDLGVGFPGLMRAPECGLERGQQTSDAFQVGDVITATVLWHDDKNHQISLIRRIQKHQREAHMAVLSEDLKNRIREYFPRYPRKQAVTLPALHLVHEEMRCVSPEAVVEIAELLELHPSEVQDTMTFYQFFKQGTDPKNDMLGQSRVWVCRGLACMLRGAYELIEHCEGKLDVHCGQTTDDGKITLEFAECIGACDGAPAVLLNDEHIMDVTTERADKLLDDLRK